MEKACPASHVSAKYQSLLPDFPPERADLFQSLHTRGLLEPLLRDRTTGKNIIWGTDTYAHLGPGFGKKEQILPQLLAGKYDEMARIRKQKALERVRRHGEVFTPQNICKKMCDYAVKILDNGDWHKFINSAVLEITCGIAPFLLSRRDAATGDFVPLSSRIGLLDRKMRVLSHKALDREEWLELACRAYASTYAYELQGDNLLVARLNFLLSFEEYMLERWRERPTQKEYARIAGIISWNVWQMDGLKGVIPFGQPKNNRQANLFGLPDGLPHTPFCLIKNCKSEKIVTYVSLARENSMKFDFIIGNPPYQEENEANTRMPPVYHLFMDSVYKLSDKVELITPARFLFGAGQTPKEWNKKMLNDEHLKILYYEKNSSKIFPDTEIKGGIVISYHDNKKIYEPIKIFAIFNEINSLLKKFKDNIISLSSIISNRGMYRFSELFFDEDSTRIKNIANGTGNMLTSRIFEVFNDEFNEKNDKNLMPIYGRKDNKRVCLYILKKYIQHNDFIDYYNVIIPEANGSGTYGEVLSDPEILNPGHGHTDTFLSIGKFESLDEATNCLKYIKCKFSRAMLGILKTTQHNSAPTWKYVPLQDFTASSDIDWSKSIAEIDRQLYKKYGLDEKEIDFIESHVKEMA